MCSSSTTRRASCVEKVVSKGALVAEESTAIRPATARRAWTGVVGHDETGAAQPEEIGCPPSSRSPVRVLAMEMDREVPFVRRRRDVVLPVSTASCNPTSNKTPCM